MERIQLDRVSKRYTIGDQKTAREALMGRARHLVRRGGAPAQELWSLRDVSFTVGDGEALGILGRNGAGKSTILKILTGITSPTAGVARTRGRIAALLEVGTGFHPELTGRENIYLNGAVLGMSRRDITRAFDAIVDFSGVERFLDTPVKHYSSGMGLRLGFSVAAHLEPDVLVVDEILAVGDAEFQRKCLGRMQEAEDAGRTLVFVSHDLDSLARICSRALWLDGGRVRSSGEPQALIREYLTSTQVSGHPGGALIRSGPLVVHEVEVLAPGRPRGVALLREDPVQVRVHFELDADVRDFDLAIYLTNGRGVRVLDEALSDHGQTGLPRGRYSAELRLPTSLSAGDYAVGLWCGNDHADLVNEPSAATFTLHGHRGERPDRVLVLDHPIEIAPLEQGPPLTAPGGPPVP